MTHHTRRFMTFVLGLALVLVACSSPAGSQPDNLSAASSGVCQALSLLPDASLAERAFTNRAHAALHALAGDPRLDRSLAADVLEAMLRVEDDVAQLRGSAPLGDDLRALHEAADAALAALGEDVPPCES